MPFHFYSHYHLSSKLLWAFMYLLKIKNNNIKCYRLHTDDPALNGGRRYHFHAAHFVIEITIVGHLHSSRNWKFSILLQKIKRSVKCVINYRILALQWMATETEWLKAGSQSKVVFIYWASVEDSILRGRINQRTKYIPEGNHLEHWVHCFSLKLLHLNISWPAAAVSRPPTNVQHITRVSYCFKREECLLFVLFYFSLVYLSTLSVCGKIKKIRVWLSISSISFGFFYFLFGQKNNIKEWKNLLSAL